MKRSKRVVSIQELRRRNLRRILPPTSTIVNTSTEEKPKDHDEILDSSCSSVEQGESPQRLEINDHDDEDDEILDTSSSSEEEEEVPPQPPSTRALLVEAVKVLKDAGLEAFLTSSVGGKLKGDNLYTCMSRTVSLAQYAYEKVS
jgi:hypothetical protein